MIIIIDFLLNKCWKINFTYDVKIILKKWIVSWAQGFKENSAQTEKFTESNSSKNAAIQNKRNFYNL